MRIALFGGAGQLGLEIQKRAEDLNFEVISPVISEVDVADFQQVSFLLERVKPTLIINCAAYTNVDKAEQDKELAFKINAVGAGNVAKLSSKLGLRLIHISTDFVFDGKLRRPLTEEDLPNPISIYGESKFQGELEVKKYAPNNSLIVRTSSLHGAKGNNFVHSMLKLFKEKELIKVVSDRMMCATWAGWLAEAVLDLGRLDCSGILHASCSGALSWYDFAQEILELTKARVPESARVKLEAIPGSSYPLPAARPEYSVFDLTKITKMLGRSPLSWQEGLRQHLRELSLV